MNSENMNEAKTENQSNFNKEFAKKVKKYYGEIDLTDNVQLPDELKGMSNEDVYKLMIMEAVNNTKEIKKYLKFFFGLAIVSICLIVAYALYIGQNYFR